MLEKSMSRNFPPFTFGEVVKFPICLVTHSLGGLKLISLLR
jgi:ABC-type enterobactin transport system permease subunit